MEEEQRMQLAQMQKEKPMKNVDPSLINDIKKPRDPNASYQFDISNAGNSTTMSNMQQQEESFQQITRKPYY